MNNTPSPQGYATEFYIGSDVDKKKFAVSICPPNYRDIPFQQYPRQTFRRNRSSVRKCLSWLREQIAESNPRGLKQTLRFTMEATGRYSTDLALMLLEADSTIVPSIVNPRVMKHFIQSLSPRNKTDELDAQGIARFCADRTPYCL